MKKLVLSTLSVGFIVFTLTFIVVAEPPNSDPKEASKASDFSNLLTASGLASVPEQATMIILGTGLAGLAGRKIRKKRNTEM